MATFKKTLTMSQTSTLPDRDWTDDEDLIINDITNGRVGCLQKAIWNNMPCWNDLDVARPIIRDELLYRSASINVDDTITNSLVHGATTFIKADSSNTETLESVLSNAITFTPNCYMHYTHLGDDLWTTKCVIDLRYGSETIYNTFVDMFGRESMTFSFNGELLMDDILYYGSKYEATKTFTWDKISTLSWQIQNITLGEGSSGEITTFTIS